jgi:hypothetical protein
MLEGFGHPLQLTNAIPPTSMVVAGKTLDTNGEAVVIWADNTTNDCTPVVTGYSNYLYAVEAQRVKVPLVFRNSGFLTDRDIAGVGYQSDCWITVNLTCESTNLGAANPPVTNHIYTNFWFNLQETDATAHPQSSFNSGWGWHQDVCRTIFVYIKAPDLPGAVFANDRKPFSQGTAGEVDGNDSTNSTPDTLPDANRLMLVADAPGLSPADYESEYGVVVAYRLYARQWLTWNGIRCSDILRWRSFLTIRRPANGTWERRGDNRIEPTPEGDPEAPTFTVEEGAQALQEP